jgi:orotidine 5'-phosphate decarboxylase subfamily 1
MKQTSLTYRARGDLCRHPLAKQLFYLMADKQTNLSVSADVTTKQALLTLADAVGPHICVLKTHIDIINDFDWDLIEQLTQLARRHQFLIFEDRKFADIGSTVQHQYQGGIYRIAEWADIINAHPVPGPGIIAGLKSVGFNKQRGLLLLAEMSSEGNLAKDAYQQATLAMAQQHKDFVIGFIAQHQLLSDPEFIYLTPGVNLVQQGDALGQHYTDPATVILEQGSDIIIVGRAIYASNDPSAAARLYREAGWQAYIQRTQ